MADNEQAERRLIPLSSALFTSTQTHSLERVASQPVWVKETKQKADTHTEKERSAAAAKTARSNINVRSHIYLNLHSGCVALTSRKRNGREENKLTGLEGCVLLQVYYTYTSLKIYLQMDNRCAHWQQICRCRGMYLVLVIANAAGQRHWAQGKKIFFSLICIIVPIELVLNECLLRFRNAIQPHTELDSIY